VAKRIPPEAIVYLQSLGKKFGSLGGKTAARNMTPEERLARARKASDAAARKRRAARLAGTRVKKSTQH
jgi:hypothetical protein